MAKGPYVCGVDAGGTKSQCAICMVDGAVLVSLLSHPAPLSGDAAHFGQIMTRVVEEACGRAGVTTAELSVVVAGISGVDTPALKERAHSALQAALPETRVMVHNDATIALEAATSVRPAGVLMGGTGSIGYGEDATGRAHRVGGWGHVFGDEGSGYYIAVSAVASVLRGVDGRDGETSLGARLLNHFALVDPREVMELTQLAAQEPRTLAAFAPQVFEAEREGDAVAGAIIERAAGDLAAIGIRLLDLIDASGAATLSLGGSLLERDRRYARMVEERILAAKPSARIVGSLLPPVAGGLLKAIGELNGGANYESLRRNLADGLQRATTSLSSVANEGD